MITTELLDKILLEWSYRCDKGYPDVNNPADWLVLENVLVEMGIELPFERILEENITTPVVKNSIKVDTIEEDDKLIKQARKAASELDKLISTIPAMPISEKWGVMGSDERKEFESRLKSLLKGAGSDPIERLRSFITNVNGVSKKSSSNNISDVFNRLVLLRTINNIVTGFSPAGAGFIFEALTAAIMGGKQETGKNEEGVLANADVTVDGKSYSMKLLSGKSSKLKGSKPGLAAGVKQYGTVTYVIMLRESTTGGKVSFYTGEVTPENLFASDASKIGLKGFIVNGNYKMFQQGKWKLEEDPQFKFLPTESGLKSRFSNVTFLGALDVESNTIRNVVQESLIDLQQKVEPIYNALKEFTINLHSYFGAEKTKERTKAAIGAKKSAAQLDSETQRVVQ